MVNYYKILPKKTKKQNGFFRFFTDLDLVTQIIILNVAIFIGFSIAEAIMGSSSNLIYDLFAVQANNLFLRGYIWTLLTSVFMHASVIHILANMFSLYFLGRFLEMIIGRKRFLWFYLISGIFASFFFASFSFIFGNSVLGAKVFGSPETFAVGASGAIFAIAGLLALLTPRNRAYLILGPFIAVILEAIIYSVTQNSLILNLVDIAVVIYLFVSLFSFFSLNPLARRLAFAVDIPFWVIPIIAIVPLVIVSFFVQLPIGNMAHLGGFIAGVIYGIYLKKRYKKKTRMIAEYFSK